MTNIDRGWLGIVAGVVMALGSGCGSLEVGVHPAREPSASARTPTSQPEPTQNGESAQRTPAATDPPRAGVATRGSEKPKLYAFWTFAGGNNQFDQRVASRGWEAWVERNITPEYVATFDGTFLQNPGGRGTPRAIDTRRDGSSLVTSMHFDQMLVSPGQAHADGFAAAWSPVTGRGHDVIAYIGSPVEDDKDHARASYQDRALAPLLGGGCAIAMDHSSDAGPVGTELLERLARKGATVYVEAVPERGREDLLAYGCVSSLRRWEYAGKKRDRFFRRDEFRGPTVTTVTRNDLPEAIEPGTPEEVDWLIGRVREELDAGHSVAVTVRPILEAGALGRLDLPR